MYIIRVYNAGEFVGTLYTKNNTFYSDIECKQYIKFKTYKQAEAMIEALHIMWQIFTYEIEAN